MNRVGHNSAWRTVAALAVAAVLSGCVTLGEAGGPEAAADTANAAGSRATPVYVPSNSSMLAVEPLTFDPESVPRTCVSDLRLYRAYLQMPGATNLDLSKPISAYIQEAGGADAALQSTYAQINDLNEQLDLEIARRDPFNQQARRRADDSIAAIEDRILIHQALAEALECRR